jgi:hypothetical protein
MNRLFFFLIKSVCLINFLTVLNTKCLGQTVKIAETSNNLQPNSVNFKLDSLQNEYNSLEEKLNYISLVLSDSVSVNTSNKYNHDQESLKMELTNLKKENEDLWKDIAENIIKSDATAPVKLIDVLISKNTNDAVLVSKLQAFKTQSEYLLTAQKFLMDGKGKSNYLSIKENLNKTFDTKFPEQIKLQSKLIAELEIFEDVAIELNFVIEELKFIDHSSIRTQEMEDQYKSARLIKFFPWLEQIFIANKIKHTPIGITFE